MEDQMVLVPLGPCTCPDTPHEEGDWVKLRPRLGMARALAVIRGAAQEDLAVAEMQLAVGYARFGIAEWNLTNGTGAAQPLDAEHLSAFAEQDPRAMMVAIRGDALYSEEVAAPLVMMAESSSRPSPSTASTSATIGTPPSAPRRKRSKRSSTSISQTVGTETTTASLDGGSSS